jgi:TatD DNase family protein
LPARAIDVSPALVDTHAHLDEDRFDADRSDLIDRAHQAGVSRILSIATTADSSLRAQQIADSFSGVYASAGIHPNYAAQAAPDEWDRVCALARHPRVRAIGETGLDRFHDFTPFAVQEDYFRRQLALARQLQLPVVIHCRDCEPDMLRVLRDEFDRRGPIQGVMHSFAGSRATADACLAMGLYLSFSGMITYKKNDALREVAAAAPADRILVETDCPYLAPTPHRGQRNEPAFVVHTAQGLAETRSLDLAELARLTTDNAIRLFQLPVR